VSIAEASRRTGVSAHTLRYYERAGLIDGVGRANNGHRRYAKADLDWIVFLTKLRKTGMPIRRMREFADLRRAGEHTVVRRRELLKEHGERVRAEIHTLQENLAVIDFKINLYQEME
jgi:DNA-binding transcriptional MerR regulator